MARKKPRNHSAKPVKPENRRRGLLWGGIGVVALAVGGALLYFFYRGPHPRIESGAGSNPLPGGEGRRGMTLRGQQGKTDVPVTLNTSAATPVSLATAKRLLSGEHRNTDAMAQASEQSVLGNFNNTKFNYAGITSTFSKRDGKFFVNTDGPHPAPRA